MNSNGHDVVVTSPQHAYLGSQRIRDGLLAILLGNNVPEKPTPKDNDGLVEAMKQRVRDQEPMLIFAERDAKGKWGIVPSIKINQEPYVPSPILLVEFFYNVAYFDKEDEQRKFLASVGMAIDQQIIEV